MPVPALVAGAAIAGGASLLGGLFGSKSSENVNKAQIQLAHEQMDWNERMMDKQNDWNLEQWNRQNEYNTPAAQRQRLESAGMNPIYYGLDGNGNAGALTSATPNSVSMPQLENPGLPMQAAMSQIANIAADTELKKAQANNLNAGAGLSEEQAETERQLRSGALELQGIQIKFKKFEQEFIQPAEYQKIKADGDKLVKEKDQLDEYLRLAQNKDAREEILKDIAQSHLDNETKRIANDFVIAYGHLLNDNARTTAEVKLADAKVVLTRQQVVTETSRGHLLNSQSAIAHAQAVYAVDDAKLNHEMNQYAHDSMHIEWEYVTSENTNVTWLRKSIEKWSNTLGSVTSIIKPVSGAFSPAPIHNNYRLGPTNNFNQ